MEMQKDQILVLDFMKKYFKPCEEEYIFFSEALRYLTKNENFNIKFSFSLKEIIKEASVDTVIFLINEGTNRNISNYEEALDLLKWIADELMIDDTIEMHEYFN